MNNQLRARLGGLLFGLLTTAAIALFMYGPSNLDSGVPPILESNPIKPPTSHMIALLSPPLQVDHEQAECLAKNIFYEAGVEPWEGKIGVGQVTLNRVKHSRWPNTICGVVYKRKQFSWTLKAALHERPEGPLWEASKRAARDVLEGVRLPQLKSALFYHASYMRSPPKWSDPAYFLTSIGQHMFYSNDLKL